MKTQKLNIKVRDLEPLKDVTGGRRRAQGRQHSVLALNGERSLSSFGNARIQ
jgi:hypothetical protein